MGKVVLGFVLGCFLFLLAHAEPRVLPAPPEQDFKTCEEMILYRLNFYSELYVKWRMPYKWGGSSPATSFDCSGFVYDVCKRSGLPVKRTTSYRMWLDKGSWPGERVFVKFNAHDEAVFPDLVFFTFSSARKFGHVGLVVINATDKNGRRSILFREASSSQKVLKETEMRDGDYRWIRVEGILILDLTPGFVCGG